jgi:hypothetical protein
MPVSIHKFLLNHPEFSATSAPLVERKLAAADRRVNAAVWGSLVDDGIMLMAAHLLAIAPEGEKSRMVKDDQKDVYLTEYRAMARNVTMGQGRLS